MVKIGSSLRLGLGIDMQAPDCLIPVRHRKKVPFRPEIIIPEIIRPMLGDIYAMDRELEKFVIPKKTHERFIIHAAVSNIHHSTKIEGNPFSLDHVEKLTLNALKVNPVSPQDDWETDIRNHARTWFSSSFNSTWTLRMVQKAHNFLMKGIEGTNPGILRSVRSAVVNSGGEETFLPCPPEHIEEELASLLNWMNTIGVALHPVVSASIFFHEFESIHPFLDGNGRTGRLLFHVWLYQNGLPNARLCHIEKLVLQNRELYYRTLAYTDRSWDTGYHPDGGDYTFLMHHYILSIHRAYELTVNRLQSQDFLSQKQDGITTHVLLLAQKEKDWFSITDLSNLIPSIATKTVRSRINQLHDWGLLEAKGRTRGRKFRWLNLREAMFTSQ